MVAPPNHLSDRPANISISALRDSAPIPGLVNQARPDTRFLSPGNFPREIASWFIGIIRRKVGNAFSRGNCPGFFQFRALFRVRCGWDLFGVEEVIIYGFMIGVRWGGGRCSYEGILREWRLAIGVVEWLRRCDVLALWWRCRVRIPGLEKEFFGGVWRGRIG